MKRFRDIVRFGREVACRDRPTRYVNMWPYSVDTDADGYDNVIPPASPGGTPTPGTPGVSPSPTPGTPGASPGPCCYACRCSGDAGTSEGACNMTGLCAPQAAWCYFAAGYEYCEWNGGGTFDCCFVAHPECENYSAGGDGQTSWQYRHVLSWTDCQAP